MVFSSAVFLFFFLPLVLLIYYFANPRFRNIILLIFSLFFYAWGEPTFVLLMIVSIFVNYLIALIINKPKMKKISLILLAVFNLSFFFIFKYLNFTLLNLNKYIFSNSLPQTHIMLPIGISFFTFQAISYVLDVSRGRGKVQKNPLNVALYISFFPQLIAGPIVRYETVAAEINLRHENISDFSRGIQRFVVGLGKKVILSNTVAVLADYVFSSVSISAMSVTMAWVGIISYTMQIYFDFSGYSDMAIGLGLMFGFHFDENFDYPYISKSVSEFWRRWHISLGTWFRDYVYFPLGGSRVAGKKRLIWNLFVVWSLTGIWHGANWTFVLWGLFYFVLLTFEKLTNIPKRFKTKIAKVFYRVFTIICIIIGWVIFRSDSIQHAFQYTMRMFGIGGVPFSDSVSLFLIKDNFGVLLLCTLFSTPLLTNLLNKLLNKHIMLKSVLVILGVVTLFVLSAAYIVNSSYNPFIYFNF